METETLMEILTWENTRAFLTWSLTWLSVIASIIGGVYTILVYFRVSDIEKKYLVKVRLPDLIAQLQEKNKALPKLLSDFENDNKSHEKKSAVSSSIHSIKILLEDINRKLEFDKSRIKYSSPPISKWLLSVSDEKIEKMLRFRSIDIERLWELQAELSSVITHLEQINSDIGWTRT